MFRAVTTVLFSFALIAPGIALAQEQSEQPKKEKKICRQAKGQRTGTRMGAPKICRTQAQWDTVDVRALQTGDDVNKLGMLSRDPKGVSDAAAGPR